jgi:hypothetical protein
MVFFMAQNARFIQKRFKKSVHTYKAIMFQKQLQLSKNISDIFYIFGAGTRHIFKMSMHYHGQFSFFFFLQINPKINLYS